MVRALRRRQDRRRGGFTLMEAAIGIFFLAGMLLAAGFAVDRANSMLRQRRAEEEVATLAGRLVQRAAEELAFARRSALVPDPVLPFGADSLRFQCSEGVVDGQNVWSATRTLGFEYGPGEQDDGLDNDGDGLVDEGSLVWTESAGLPQERRVVLGHGLCEYLPGEEADGVDDNGNGLTDERGISFSIAGDLLTIRIAVQGRGPRGNVITKTAQSSTFLRNLP